MATDVDIDELLKQDEAALREKKKRLKAFSAALDEARAASVKAAQAATTALNSGDLTRGDLARVFGLSKGERALLFPSSTRASAKAGDDAADGVEQSDNTDHENA